MIIISQHQRKKNIMSWQCAKQKKPPVLSNKRLFVVRPMRFERTAFGVGVQRSIQLSYGRGYKKYYTSFSAVCKASASGFFFFGFFL